MLSTEELAERWGMNGNTLRKWRMADFGPPYLKFGDAQTSPVRYRLEDIEAFERKFMQQPRNAPPESNNKQFGGMWSNAVFHGKDDK